MIARSGCFVILMGCLALSACQDVIAPISDKAQLCVADTDCADTFFCSDGRCLRPSGPRCGDGKLDPQEACDDGNRDDADGCVVCQVARCGDGAVHLGIEGCDAGDDANSDELADACRTDCSLARCGDGAVDSSESCDQGALNNNEVADRCRDDCSSPRCGDGVIDSDETCDDTNTTDTDACTNACRVARCGDGVVRTDLPESDPHYEFCDDANTNDDDDCDRFCGRGFVAVARYNDSTCVARNNGDVWCWGAVAQSDRALSMRPAQVEIPERIIDVDYKDGRGFRALSGQGKVYTWYSNSRAALLDIDGDVAALLRAPGLGSGYCLRNGVMRFGSDQFDSVTTPPLPGELVKCKIAATHQNPNNYTLDRLTWCALMRADDGRQSLYCSGCNDRGQLANGMTEPSMQPVRIPVDDVIDFRFVQRKGICALDRQRHTYCWGEGANPQVPTRILEMPFLGALDPAWHAETRQMLEISFSAVNQTWVSELGSNIERPKAYSGLVAVIDGRNRLWTKGVDYYGSLGIGRPFSYRPLRVQGVDAATQVSMGMGVSCSRRIADDHVYCWGGTHYTPYSGRVRGDTSINHWSAPPNWVGAGSELATGKSHSCLVNSSGHIICWGHRADHFRYYSQGSTELRLPDDRSAEALSLGASHTCALAEEQVYCWGSNARGQLGRGDVQGDEIPTPVFGLTEVVEVSASRHHTCALNTSGQVFCWGANSHGQTGFVSSEAEWNPQQVPLPFSALQVSAGATHTCARSDQGTIHCWGGEFNVTGLIEEERVDDFEGQVRNHEFEPVAGIDDAVWLSSGADVACAVVSGGAVKCWSHGIIENPANYDEHWRHWPYFVVTGDQSYQGSTPSLIRGLPPVVRVQVGQGHACARTSDGALWCWGSNATNQLGDDYAGDVHNDTFGLVDRMDMEFAEGE